MRLARLALWTAAWWSNALPYVALKLSLAWFQ